MAKGGVATRISPWLSVSDATRAVEYYERAFGAVAVERLEEPPGSVMVAQLSIAGATFWVQQDGETSPGALGGRSPVRMILTVEDPDTLFSRAVAAGGAEVAPVREAHGWRVGRLADPFGHHWEVGRPSHSGRQREPRRRVYTHPRRREGHASGDARVRVLSGSAP